MQSALNGGGFSSGATDGIGLALAEGYLERSWRVGLVGRNGHGKSTLFRIIVGEEGYDDGAITMPKGYRIGYVRQHIEFTENTVLAEGMRGLMPSEKDHHWKVEKILAGLGFSDGDMVRNPNEFSGGFQVRLNLAKVLVSEPDLLLLDEPLAQTGVRHPSDQDAARSVGGAPRKPASSLPAAVRSSNTLA